ncbi:hypothetical protein [Hyalangium gracile]|uniref:hypothetical protein n=1 Tax=Hyalangium gracile TaxID=394092 RepID=UPI001CCD5ADE|nr:hypothetical protein [Hyalangium gracile]
MKIMNRKFLVAGLIAGALTFVGCKSNSGAETGTGTTDTTTGTGTGTDTTGTGTGTGTDTSGSGTGTGTTTDPGTGGSGSDISTTKQSDDNLRMPEDDPMRTRESESIRDSEAEPGVHDDTTLPPESGTGGAGFGDDAIDNNPMDDDLNPGGNVDDLRTPESPSDYVSPDGLTDDTSDLPEGAR